MVVVIDLPEGAVENAVVELKENKKKLSEGIASPISGEQLANMRPFGKAKTTIENNGIIRQLAASARS